ncbi:MAG TPA: hypothetical protein VGP22_02585 [Albitalea sp.]|nr:hypothetical protein [Albitalea sp.]
MKTSLSKTFALAAMAVSAMFQSAHGVGLFGDQDVDPRIRAKIMKEKVKQEQLANSFSFANNGTAAGDGQCGSQNIGNVDTGGKIGASPREVFVFAPNAVNLVSGQGCK